MLAHRTGRYYRGPPLALSSWSMLQYSTSTPFSETSERLRTLNECIWAVGAPTLEISILMVLAPSSSDFRRVRDAPITSPVSSAASSPYTLPTCASVQTLSSESATRTIFVPLYRVKLRRKNRTLPAHRLYVRTVGSQIATLTLAFENLKGAA